ncbi:outer membrane translocation and assembly module TamA [Flavobacterium lacus]|uniref:Outer membrane translocation and assembly module TamA n=2 Tax=Flavobacterium lacus TaxID=1353778 RepID=A0A328WVZ7_9FLAO|nr:outer membrane translocation and assembly module TamA [Flavobacterium lacus]
MEGSTIEETKKMDSIGYAKQFVNAKGVIDETKLFSKKLFEFGYLENENLSNRKVNDSTFLFEFRLGEKTSHVHIYIGDEMLPYLSDDFKVTDGLLKLPIENAEPLMNSILKRLESKGFSLAQLKLENFRTQENLLYADLNSKPNKQRNLNDIVIEGFEKFPESHRKSLKKMFTKQTFNQTNLEKLYKTVESFRFVTQTKYPEILFTQDSTKVYLYLEKAKANRFDGFVGFNNDDGGKINFNGYVDLLLHNLLNSGEQFTMFWKSDGNEQTTFNVNLQVPYLFKSSLGLKTELQIFKQDSTFQNTRTSIDLGYLFTYNTRFYLGYQSTESSDIQNTNSNFISDFKNSFVTGQFEYTDFKTDDFLFPEKTAFDVKVGLGSRDSKTDSQSQLYGQLEFRHNLYLNAKNILHLKTQNYYLKSEAYIVNELHRFGGINSIRGFNENSLQGNLFSSILTEYRYVLTSGMYLHSIIDYGYFQDQTTDLSDSLLGLGFGFGLLTKNGLFNLVYANGSTGNQEIKLSNSIVHISFKTSF